MNVEREVLKAASQGKVEEATYAYAENVDYSYYGISENSKVVVSFTTYQKEKVTYSINGMCGVKAPTFALVRVPNNDT